MCRYGGSNVTILYPSCRGIFICISSIKKKIGDEIKVRTLELSGRGEKADRGVYTSIHEAVEDIYEDMWNLLDAESYCILGHSMGSWIAYELYYKIKSRGHRPPEHMFFSGNTAPPKKQRKGGIHQLPDDELIEKIYDLGYTHKKIFDIERTRHLFLPLIRADLKITETYLCDKNRMPLDCNITVLNGMEDTILNEDINGWKAVTNKQCEMIFFPGNHFFIYEHTEQISKIIIHTIRNHRDGHGYYNAL